MPKYLALRDRRLHGGAPARPNLYIVNSDATTPLSSSFHEIHAYTRKAPVHTIFVLCHGYAGEDRFKTVCADMGGMGLQLGSEGVTVQNVSIWSAIRGAAQNIVVYSCAAADTEPGDEGTDADGRYLMGCLALHTGATVYAADRIQWYGTYNGLPRGRYEFGAWEGQLWRFPANGASPSLVAAKRVPVELSDVWTGAAP